MCKSTFNTKMVHAQLFVGYVLWLLNSGLDKAFLGQLFVVLALC